MLSRINNPYICSSRFFNFYFCIYNSKIKLETCYVIFKNLTKHCIFSCHYVIFVASLVAQMVKHLPAMRETWVWFLGWEDPLEKEMAIHSSTLAWKIPWTEEPNRLHPMGSQRVGHNWATSLHFTSWCYFLINLTQVRFIYNKMHWFKIYCPVSFS